jgi:hypothetical protein
MRLTQLVFGLSLAILVISVVVFKLYDHPVTEGLTIDYMNIGDEQHMRAQTAAVNYLESRPNRNVVEEIQIAAYDPDIVNKNQTIFVRDPKITGIPMNYIAGDADYSVNNIAIDVMNKNPQQKIKWEDVYVDANKSEKRTINVYKKPAKIVFNDDACSTKSLLNSDVKDDFCTKYIGDNVKKNAKCEELSAENCTIPKCCVLVNGNRCMAGDANGPTYLTDEGKSVDHTYYYHKSQCYGNCDAAKKYANACNNYNAGSTWVSKQCMVQMFNSYGCPNPKPNKLINDAMVKAYRKTSKHYVERYIKTAVDTLKATNDDTSQILCYGQ